MKIIITAVKMIVIGTLLLTMNGCVKDTCHQLHTYSYNVPVYRTTAEVRANLKSGPATDLKSPGKIVTLGQYIFLNEVNKGIHVIDNSNPSAPHNIAFIDIPGNVDLAIKGNTLYADLYTDLVIMDISDPQNVTTSKIVEGVFPDRSYGTGFSPDRSLVIHDWVVRDTTIEENCQTELAPGGLFDSMASGNGIAKTATIGITGSMSRFAIAGNYLYTVSSPDLNVFDISNAHDPAFMNKIHVDWHVETIFPFKNTLFVGSNNGMFMYDILSSPSHPNNVGQFTHARSCDPVIADNRYAYITLHSGSSCEAFNNELDVVQLNNLSDAQLVKTYAMTSPHGLSKDGNLLFLCDGIAGLKIYDASNVQNLQLLKQFSGIETFDIIANNSIALVVAKDGLYQYGYASINNIHLLSKLPIVN